MLSVSGAGREGGNAGSDEEVWANPIIKLAVIAAPAYYVPTRTAVSNVFRAKHGTKNIKHLHESTAATWRGEALCV